MSQMTKFPKIARWALLEALVLLVMCAASVIAQPKINIRLDLDKTTLYLPCRYPIPAKYRTCPEGMTVNVSAVVRTKSKSKLSYKYVVGYGAIVGTGPNVVWDMTKQVPGTYVIKLIVGKGPSAIVAEKILTVAYCADGTMECLDCPHDMLESSNSTVRTGDIVEVKLKGALDGRYNWKVDGGIVIDGQGTDRVKVKVEKVTNRSTVAITLEVLDSFCFEVWHCPLPQIELVIENP